MNKVNITINFSISRDLHKSHIFRDEITNNMHYDYVTAFNCTSHI